eukprot:18444-Heterococcus_DN1.PRE.2
MTGEHAHRARESATINTSMRYYRNNNCSRMMDSVLGRLTSIPITVLFCNPELTMQREVYESVGGSSRAIAALQRIVDAGHGGVLLYGPTGTGKTLLATAAAQCSGRRHFLLHCSSVFRRNRGEAEAYLQQFLHEAKLAAPSVVLLDQIDLLSAPRHKAAGITELQVASVLLETLDDWHRSYQEASDRTAAVHGVVVIATSLSMAALDPSLLLRGRLEVHIPLTAPSVEERLAILQIHAKSIPLETTAAATAAIAAAGSSSDDTSRTALLTQVASRCHGYVGSDLKHLCTEAATRAAVEQAECVTADHFYSAIANGRPAALTTQAIGATHRPAVKLSDVQGCDNQIAELRAALLVPLARPHLLRRLGLTAPGGVLLYGPSGCGKTLIANAIAAAAAQHANFIPVQCTELIDKVVGRSEAAVSRLFAAARAAAPCLLFLDQIESVGAARGTHSSTQSTMD